MIIASTSSKAIAAEVAKAPLKPSFWAIKEVVNSTIDGHHVDNDVLRPSRVMDGPNAQVESHYVPSVFLVKLSHPNVWNNKSINVRLAIVS